jgi:HAD superfamily hydrolase (TIGR01509 family)
MKALIFDCDGVLVDTEKDGHRIAFNRAFAALGLDTHWDVEYYGELLKIAGGKERMRHHFEASGWPQAAGADRDAFIAELHKTKTASFMEIVETGTLPLRAGIVRIVDEAIQAGVRLGVCTTSNSKSVAGVLALLGPERKTAFEFVLAGDVVAKKKPDPEIYLMARDRLGLGAEQCRVIEDSRNGMLAALGAKIPVLVTTSTYTIDEDFSGAARVVPELGEPPASYLTLADLASLSNN